MEHPCQRCSSEVAANLPFCPNCEAPQIHFSRPEDSGAPVVVAASGAAAFAANQTSVQAPAYAVPPPLATRSPGFDWQGALPPALNAGAIAAILILLPLGRAFIIALPLAGFLCVLFYRRRSLGAEPSPGLGFRLGALSGAFGFAIFAVLTAAGTIIFHAQSDLRDAMIQAIKQAQARGADPQARQMMDYFLTPQGLALMLIFGAIVMGIVFVVLSGMGGAVSAALLRRKGPPA